MYLNNYVIMFSANQNKKIGIILVLDDLFKLQIQVYEFHFSV